MINSKVMKAELLAYWRYVRQMPLVGIECYDQDVLIVTKDRKLIINEVKVSISDLRADGSKEVHFRIAHMFGLTKEPKNYKEALAQAKAHWTHDIRTPNQFYFAVPQELVEKATVVVEERYPYAGLISVHHYPENKLWGHHVVVVRQAKMLHKGKCDIQTVSALVKSLTASLASAYKYVAKASSKETPSEIPPAEVS